MLYNIIAFMADAYISIVTCWIVSRFKQVFCNRLQKSSMAVLMDDVFYVINGDLLINNLFWRIVFNNISDLYCRYSWWWS